MPRFFFNSLVVAVAVTLGNLVFAPMLGYALAKLRFAGKGVLMGLVLATLMLPGAATLIPLFVLMSALGLVNSYPALILPFLAGPFSVFLTRQFFIGLPDELLEAARMDGASEFRIFAQIAMPLAGPVLATLAILVFLGTWNAFIYPLVMAQEPEMYTLPVALATFATGQFQADHGMLMAGLGAPHRTGPRDLPAAPALDHRRHRHDRPQGLIHPRRPRHEPARTTWRTAVCPADPPPRSWPSWPPPPSP